MTGSLERLAAAGIQIVPAGINSHFILERGGMVVFVERREDDFGNIGAPGIMTEHGFAALVWRGKDAWLVARGFEQAATGEQVSELRAFSRDVQQAIGQPGGEAA